MYDKPLIWRQTMKRTLVRSLQALLMTVVMMLIVVVQPATAANKAKVQTQKSNYAPNEAIVVEYSDFPGNAYDWISLAPADTPDSNYNQWFFTKGNPSGNHTFQGLASGDYQVRGYFNWSAGGFIVQTRSDFTVSEEKPVKYGESFYLENQKSEGYLDVDGEADYCAATTKFNVVTDTDKETSTFWKFESATGASEGNPVSIGDLVYLQEPDINSYLDICGLANCQGVSEFPAVTDAEPDRVGVGTGTWKIESATGAPEGTPVSTGDLIYLQNQWSALQSYLQPEKCALDNSTPTKVVTIPGNPGEEVIWKILD